MRIQVPSFRTQILIVVIFLLFNSVFFFRNYFLNSFADYSNAVESVDTQGNFNELYKSYYQYLGQDQKQKFKNDIENNLAAERQKSLAQDLFKKEISLYSKFIFVFLTLSVLILFFISFNLITRPLNRLQTATNDLSKGNWNVQVQESRFSPLNSLIVSFNAMIRELESNRNKLVQAEKESAWRDLARVMAHEIKNPLTPIRLSLERLEQKYKIKSNDLEAVFKNSTAIIHEEVDNLQRFASEFSQYAKLPTAQPTYYNLNEQLNEIISPYRDQAKIKLELEPVIPSFYGDRTQIKQIFTNLIQNSIQSSGHGCKILISTKADQENITVTVVDNGPGIPEKDLSKIFNPYFTKRIKGTGLGLSIVKRIVEGHDGSIMVKSEERTGTTFLINFPVQSINQE